MDQRAEGDVPATDIWARKGQPSELDVSGKPKSLIDEPMTRKEVKADIEVSIADCLWHNCGSFIDCKTNDLEGAAEIIIKYLDEMGYCIVRSPWRNR